VDTRFAASPDSTRITFDVNGAGCPRLLLHGESDEPLSRLVDMSAIKHEREKGEITNELLQATLVACDYKPDSQ
jgi:hypothetical protein